MPKAEGAENVPQSPQEAPSATEHVPKRGSLGGRFRLRNWRVLTRLAALIAVPTIVAALLAGNRVSISMDDADAYRKTGQLATLGKELTALAQDVENERDAFAERSAGGAQAISTNTMNLRRDSVDATARRVREAARKVRPDSPTLRLAVANVVNRVEELPALRSIALRLAPGQIVDKYSEFVEDFNNFHILVSQDAQTPELAQSALALADIARAKDAASRERALIATALWQGRFEPIDRASVDDARASMNTNIASFRSTATRAQLQLYDDNVTGPELDRGEVTRLQALARADASAHLRVRLGITAARDWELDSTARVDRLRTVETDLATKLADQANKARDDAESAALRDGVLLFVVLAVVLGTVIVVARSLVRPLRRLQAGALEVASTRLPGLVDRLRDPEAAAGGIEVEPIEVNSTDEIGQVARAFDEVHREAVRLAADEAVLRGNINAMFVNLSRRSQSLIERQLRLIEELEQSERDEDQLANLFRLDHLATRMRRNCENLLVLGGQEQVRRWNQAVPLIDVVRASLSEVEQYERIALRVQGDMTVAGPVVNDLVHLLAELVENATVFSADHTKVTVSGQMLSGGGAMLQITDNGVGMSPEELEQANWRLANPPVIDFSAARRMGLFVVGRLAVRHGVRVELRAAQGGGLTAFVVLPDAVVSPGEPVGVGARGLGVRESEGPGQLAALTTAGEQPALGGTGALPAIGGTGAFPALGGTGAQPALGGTGAQPALGGTGAQPALGGTGAQPSLGGTGAQPSLGGTGAQPSLGGTGAQPSVGGTGQHPVAGTGAHPLVGGGHPMVGGTGPQRPLRGGTAPQPIANPSGPLPAVGGPGSRRTGGTGPLTPPPGGTGPLTPPGGGTGPLTLPGGSGAHAAFPGTGPLPSVPPGEHRAGDDRRPPAPRSPAESPASAEPPRRSAEPPRRPGELPVRQPGAQLPGRSAAQPAGDGEPNGLFQPRSERLQAGGAEPRRPGRHTGPTPVVPEAQPMVPEAGPQRRIPWETGPLQQVGDDTGAPPADPYADGSPSGAQPQVPAGGDRWGGIGGPAAPEPARPGSSQPTADPPEDAIPEPPLPEPSGYEHPVQAAPVPSPARPASQRPAPPRKAPRVPERSPIFDAMQSEWFLRRADGGMAGEDPVKGWESPADAGFRAAEATREPIAGKRTSAGLPKRVPGKNRVPGAVARQTPAAAAEPAAAEPPAQERPGRDRPAPAPGQPADVVRNRFASLQRGVHRGRSETRGTGTSGEAPSQGDDETGGTR